MSECLSHIGLCDSELDPALFEVLCESLQLSRIRVWFASDTRR